MKIGIDATALPPQPVGAGNYIIQLVRSLAEVDTNDEIVVFVQERRQPLFNLTSLSNITWEIVSDKNPAYRMVWEQITLPRIIQLAGVDLLHSLHYTRPANLPCASVVTIHDMTFFLYPELHTHVKRFFFPRAIRSSVRRADALIAISESTRQDSIRILGIPPEKIHTVLLGVTEEFRIITDHDLLSEIRKRYNLPELFILYVGLVEPRKNLPMLIDAFKKFVDAGYQYDLVIVGRFGWMYERVLRRIEELGLHHQVHFTGYVPQQDLPMVYNLASVSVYPTRYEGFGLPALESMACGTPVITTAISSLPEIVGDAGILIPSGDESALIHAMIEVLNNATLHQQLSIEGLKRAKQFTWQRTARETMKVYQTVLAGM